MDSSTMQRPVLLALIFGLALGASNTAMAASKLESLTIAPATNSAELMDAASLEDVVARVALYPDELLAVVLPASTFPLQIVQAARYLEAHKSDPTLEPNAAWDESIVALLNYPEVITLLNTDLDWTWQLGEAVIKQQSDVIVAIERFRERAYAAGNLKSDEHKVVKREHNAVAITSADPDAVYVPYYEPEQVIYRQRVTPYYYYPTRYPLYYYPYSPGHAFHSRAFWGITTAFTIGWYTKHLHYHPYGYRSHPFYGHRYHRSNFRRHGLHAGRRHINSTHRHKRHYHGDHWNGNNRLGHRPRHLRRSDAHRNVGFGGHRGHNDAPLRAANGLLGNGTDHHRRSANHHDRFRSRNHGQTTDIPRAANGLIGNGVHNRRPPVNRGRGFRDSQQNQATTTPRSANGLIGNGTGSRRGFSNGSNAVPRLRPGTATTIPRASNGFINNRVARANRAGSRQNATRRSAGPAAQTRAPTRSGNPADFLANNNFTGGGLRAAAVDFNASRRASKARLSNRSAVSSPRSNARGNRPLRNRSNGTGNHAGRGSRGSSAGFGRSAMRAR